jgi:hypothetical protein
MTRKRNRQQGRARAAPIVRPRPAPSVPATPRGRLARLLHWPPELRLRQVAALALLAVLALVVVFGIHDQRLSPYSIVSLELAWTPERAGEIFQAWGAAGLHTARRSLLIDLAFMPAYALLFASLVLILARQARGRWQTAGLWLVLAPFAAWLFDLIENATLLRVLGSAADPPATELTLAGAAAVLKFALLIACLVYMLAMLLRLRRRTARG